MDKSWAFVVLAYPDRLANIITLGVQLININNCVVVFTVESTESLIDPHTYVIAL